MKQDGTIFQAIYRFLFVPALGLVLIVAGAARAQMQMASADIPPAAPAAVSPASDRHETQQIRRAIIADRQLSMAAHNCEIITRTGNVTLMGSVRSDDERRRVAQLAAGVVGAQHVTNSLTVRTNQLN